jgi:hypothetical protein
MEAVGTYVEAAKEREFLRVMDSIWNDGSDFRLGECELAIVEEALRHVDSGESLLVHTHFPSDSVPLALAATYAYSQRPAFGGDAKPLLLFPSSGYITQLDTFHHARTLNYDSNKVDSLISRTIVRAASEVPNDWGVYSAPATGSFAFDKDGWSHVGAMFVDLRRPEWSERAFDGIWRLFDGSVGVPAIFYARDMDAAAGLVEDRLNTEKLEVTNKMLASAGDHECRENESPSNLTLQQNVFASGEVKAICRPVVDEEFGELVPDFIHMKNNLQDRDIATIAVGRVFNLLTKQPFKPKYWEERAKGDGYYSHVNTYIDILRDKSDNVDGAAGGMLSNYARHAEDVQGHLNEKHAVQSMAFHLMKEAAEDDGETLFVVNNTAERDAFIHAATSEGYRIPDNTKLVEIGKLAPKPAARHVFLSPPSFSNQYVFEFPPSERVEFLHHAMWGDYIARTAEQSLDGIPSTHSTKTVGGGSSGGAVDDFVFDIDQLEDELEKRLKNDPMSLISGGAGEGSGGRGGSGGSGTGASRGEESIRIHLDDGDHIDATPRQHITVYDEGTAGISHTVAEAVSVGDEVLRISDAAADIYDVLVESVDSRQSMRKHFNTVSEWREMLDSEMNARGLSTDDVVAMLRERGSDLEEGSRAVAKWRSGKRYGPGDKDDLRRTIQIFRPQVEEAVLDQVYRTVWNSLKTIRDEHRRIGRDTRRILAAEMRPGTSATVRGSVNESLIKDKARDLEKVAIVDIEEQDGNED